MDELDLGTLNPGIRKTVAWLRANGFQTVDSGDGKTHEYECDQEAPYVVMTARAHDLASKAGYLYFLLCHLGVPMVPIGGDGVWIQATFDPGDGSALIQIENLDDALLDSLGVK
jgi:hypothetical protein